MAEPLEVIFICSGNVPFVVEWSTKSFHLNLNMRCLRFAVRRMEWSKKVEIDLKSDFQRELQERKGTGSR